MITLITPHEIVGVINSQKKIKGKHCDKIFISARREF